MLVDYFYLMRFLPNAIMEDFSPQSQNLLSTRFKQVLEESIKGKHFPGALCHNHASTDYPPLKKDWSKECDSGWSTEK